MIRTVIVYVILFISMRFMGKRQLGQLQPSELVVTLLISELVSLALQEKDYPVINSVIAIVMLISLEMIVSNLMLKIPLVQRIVSGRPKAIVENGEINQKAMKDVRLTVEDLFQALREQGIFDLQDTQYVLMEGNGKITTSPNVSKSGEKVNSPMVVISDGSLCKWGMDLCNIDDTWVYEILAEKSLDIEDVFLMTANFDKKYFIVKKGKIKER